MKYEPIILKINKYGIDFFFERKYGEHWFYQVHSLESEKSKKWWDEHLQEKMWYTPEVRARVLKLIDDYLNNYVKNYETTTTI